MKKKKKEESVCPYNFFPHCSNDLYIFTASFTVYKLVPTSGFTKKIIYFLDVRKGGVQIFVTDLLSRENFQQNFYVTLKYYV